VKFKSQVYTEASGSIGGVTYSRNRGGAYTRSRTVPVNPNSPEQQAVRGLVATLTSTWGNVLTAGQRDAWDFYAESVPLPDALGEPRNPGGLGMYVRCNVPRLQTTLARIDDAPGVFDLGVFTNPSVDSVDAAADTIDVAFTNTDPWATAVGGGMLVYASRPKNPTINYFKGPYRFAGLVAGAAVAPTSPATVDLPFPVVVGQRIFVQLRFSQVDGRLSLPFRLFGTAA